MTVQTNTNVASFNGNGVTQIFPIAFKFNNDTDLAVLLVDDATGVASLLTLNSDYTVSGEGDEAGGLINVVVAPAVGKRLKVTRVVDILQQTDLRNQGKFFAEVHEDAFDLLTMIAQQHETSIKSSLRVAASDPEPARIPPVAQRAGKILAFDNDGNPIVVVPVSDSSASLRLELAAEAGASMIGGNAQVVDSIAALRALLTTSPSKSAFVTGYEAQGDGGGGPYYLDESDTTTPDDGGTVVVAVDGGRWKLVHSGVLSVKQFGAKGDNVNDDSIPAQACIDALIAAGGGTVVFPGGTYNFQSKRPAGLTPKAFEDPNLFVKDADNIHLVGTGDSVLTNSVYPNNRAEIVLFYRCRNCSVRGLTFLGNNTDMPPEVNNCAIGMLSNQQMVIRDNIMRGFQGSYIASSWLFDSEISGNVFEVLGGSGIDCAFWQDVRVLGNTFKGNGLGNNGLGTQGMQCAYDTPNVDNNETGVFFRLYSNHVTVNENLFTGFTTGLYLADMVDARVEDNDFHNNYLSTANQSWGCVISNTISNFAMRGIRLAENTFSNNGSPDGGGGLTLSVGTATSAEVEINENDFYDNRAIGLQINAGVVLRGRNNTFGNRLTAQQTTNVTGALSAGVGSLFVDNPGFNPAASFGPALPAGLGFANAVTNNRPYPATIYQNGGAGIHIVMPSGADVTLFPGDSKIIRLPAYAKIYFEATNTNGWTWVFE